MMPDTNVVQLPVAADPRPFRSPDAAWFWTMSILQARRDGVGASFGTGTPQSRAQEFLAQIEPVLPGISARWNGKATVDYWTGYEWTRGSYSYWKVGQYTQFAGIERERQGNCHFAGEHTSIDFQGYLNGAVESGERAASEILADFKSAFVPARGMLVPA